jgi:hypothetical protein
MGGEDGAGRVDADVDADVVAEPKSDANGFILPFLTGWFSSLSPAPTGGSPLPNGGKGSEADSADREKVGKAVNDSICVGRMEERAEARVAASLSASSSGESAGMTDSIVRLSLVEVSIVYDTI